MPEQNQAISAGLSHSPSVSTSSTGQKKRIDDRNQKYIRLIDAPELNLTTFQRDILKGRWLNQMDWFSRKAGFYQQWFYWIRLITIIFSVLAPVLIGLGSVRGERLSEQELSQLAKEVATLVRASDQPPAPVPPPGVASPVPEGTATPAPVNSASPIATQAPEANASSIQLRDVYFHSGLFLSQIVAILAAVDQFFKFGDRWRHYRRSAEALKSHGWQFFQLGGAYAAFSKSGGHAAAFPVFAAQVEEIIQSDVEGFVSQIAVQKQLDKQEEVTDANISSK
jgi:Protein of unknown function (DUF4231)